MWTAVGSELRKATRRLFRTPLFSGTVVLILALGIGAATAIFTVVDGILLDPLPLADSEDLVIVCEQHPSIARFCIGSAPTMTDLSRQASTLESIGLARRWPFNVREGERRIAVQPGLATPGFFQALKAEPVIGRLFAPDEVGEEANVVLLGHAAWATHFGADPAVVGRSISVNGIPHIVVGVLPPDLELPTLPGVQLWRPLHFNPSLEARRSWRGFQVVGRLAQGQGLEAARTELKAIYGALRQETEAITDDWRLEVVPLKNRVVAGVRGTLLVFLGAVALLLLIACANVANLILVRSARRSRDFAVRAALGADRRALASTVLTESALLSLTGGLLGFGLAWAGKRAFLALAPPGIPRLENVAMDGTVFLFAVAASGATLLLFGALPAIRTDEAGLVDVLRGASTRSSSDGGGPRRLLVVAEVALAVMLLTTAGLLTRSYVGFLQWDPGFPRDGLAAMSVHLVREAVRDEPLAAVLARAEDVAEEVPGVVDASFASAIPLLGGREGLPYRVEGSPDLDDEDLPRARVYDISPDHFETLGVPVISGRSFTESDGAESEPVLMVNEAFVRANWPGGRGVTQRLVVPAGNWSSEDVRYRIVGVVADVPPLTPGETPEPEAYRSNRQYARPLPFLLIRAADDPSATAARVQQRLLARVSPDLIITQWGTMDSLMDRQLVRPRFQMALIGTFAGAALALTLVGLYGTLAYSVVQRNREMGIRLAVGSQRRAVLATILWDGLRMATLGAVLGTAGSLAAAGLVSSVVYGVEPSDPFTLGATAVLMLILAAGASLIPAARATRINPVELLREE